MIFNPSCLSSFQTFNIYYEVLRDILTKKKKIFNTIHCSSTDLLETKKEELDL